MLLRRRANGIAALLGALLLTTAAAAQATFGALPDPITTRELLGLLERLGPSPAQIDAAERAHDAYKEAFARLRDTEIADYLRSRRADPHELFPDRGRLGRLARTGDALRRRIKELDEQLFLAIGAVLSEEQTASLPRVRLERARARLLDERGRIPTEEIVDLAALARDLDLPPADRLAADPVLAEYEVRLTERLRALARTNRSLDRGLLDRLEALGFGPADLDDPEQREPALAAMRAYWSQAESDAVRGSEDARGLGRSACDRAGAGLSASARRRLRDAYYRAAYPDLDAEFPVLATLLRRIETDETLDAAQRREVVTLREGYEARGDARLTRVADALDAFFAVRAPFDFDSPEEDAIERRLEREAAVAMTEHETTVLQLREILGAAGVDRHGLHDVQTVIEIAMGVHASSAPAGPADAAEALDRPEPDGLPPPLDAADAAALATALGLDADGRAAMESARAEHQEQYRAARASLAGVMRETTGAIERWEDDPDAEIDADAVLDRAYGARRIFRGAVAGLDAAFIAGVRDIAGPDDAAPDVAREAAAAATRAALDAWRHARTRRVHAIGSDPDAFPGTGPETLIDLPILLASAGVERAALASIEPDLAAYEERVGAMLAARADAAEAYLEAADRWTLAPRAARAELEARLDAVAGRLATAGRAIVDLNRAMLAQVTAALGPPAGDALERAYARAAHPDAYDDPAYAGRELARALEREDLTGEESAWLAEIASAFHRDYERVCRALVAVEEGAGRGDIDEIESAERTIRLRLERDEINARAERKLRAIAGRSPDHSN